MRLRRWALAFAVAVSAILGACRVALPQTDANPCPELAAALPGTWIALPGSASLPEWFRITPVSNVEGIWERDGMRLVYGMEVECRGILLTDGLDQLYQTWTIEPGDGTLRVTGPWARQRTYYRSGGGFVNQGVGTGGATGSGPIRTYAVYAASPHRVQRFGGEGDYAYSVAGSLGTALEVFYGESLQDPANPSLGLAPLEVALAADLDVRGRAPTAVADTWTVVQAPASAQPAVARTGLGRGTLTNLTQGGLYRVRYDPGGGGSPTTINVYLPLAGAEVEERVLLDIQAADAFAQRAAQNHPVIFLWDLPAWFWDGGHGDYAGRAEPGEPSWGAAWSPHNPVLTVTTNPDQVLGGGGVVTWAGVPTRTSNLSNFLVGYALAALGENDFVIWGVQQRGTKDSVPADRLYWSGVHLARGEITWDAVRTTVGVVFALGDDRNQKLWPNGGALANRVPFVEFDDPDREFTSPGFLWMEPVAP